MKELLGPDPVAVLLGGGIESTSLVDQLLQAGQRVIPVHVHCGLIWDDAELAHVERFLAAVRTSGLSPLVPIRISLREFLGSHWSVTGEQIPRAGANSAALEIPLRNLTLLGFSIRALPCATSHILVLGTTADNSYRDGSRRYFDLCEPVLSEETGGAVRVWTPFIELTKTQVIQQTPPKILALSFSCVAPHQGMSCGTCIKCGRRQAAFLAAGVDDPTVYSSSSL